MKPNQMQTFYCTASRKESAYPGGAGVVASEEVALEPRAVEGRHHPARLRLDRVEQAHHRRQAAPHRQHHTRVPVRLHDGSSVLILDIYHLVLS